MDNKIEPCFLKQNSICYSILVSHVDSTWNTFLPYLSTFSEKLETLGFRYDGEQVTIVKEEFAEGKRRFDQ